MSIDFGHKDANLYKIKKNEYIFEQNEPFESIHILRRGALELVRNRNRVALIDSYNAPIGNFGLLMEGNRHFGARALGQTQILSVELNKTELFNWFQENPEIHLDELKNISQLLDQVNRENKSGFERYREIRPMFSSLVEPLVQLVRNESTKPNKTMKRILKNHLKIIGQTSKSGTVTVDDITLSDNVKRRFKAGETICEEGDEGEELFLHLDGVLSVLKEGQMVANIEKTGVLFGEMAPLIDGKRKATVQADTEAVLAVLPLQSLPGLFESSPAIARKITNLLISRLEKAIELNDRLREFSEDITHLFGNPKELRKQKSELAKYLNTVSPSSEKSKESIQKLKKWIESEPEIPPGFQAKVIGEDQTGTNAGFTETIG